MVYVNGDGIPLPLLDSYTVRGCSNSDLSGLMGGDRTICDKVIWTNGSLYLTLHGMPLLTSKSTGITVSRGGVATGPVIIRSYQTRVTDQAGFSFSRTPYGL
jgi:hypothetical protein